MNKSFLKIARYTAFLALGIVLLYFAFRNVDFPEMISILKGAKYSWVFLSLFLSILAFISRARRWVLLIEPLGHKPSLWNTLNSVMFGYLANYALPRMGEISKCIALNRKEKIPVDSLIGTIVIERTIDLLSLLVITVFLLIARFEKFGTFFNDYILENLGAKTSGLLMDNLLFWSIVFGAFLITVILITIYRKKLLNLKIVQKILGFGKSFAKGFKAIGKMKNKWEFIFHTVFIWGCYSLMTWVVVFALPEITGDFKFSDGIFLLVIGSLGMAAPVQAGIGAFQWMVSRGLMTIYGIGETEAQSFASLQYFSQTLLVLLLGTIATLFLYTKIGNRKKTHNRIGISLELMESKVLNLNSKDTKVLEDLRKGKNSSVYKWMFRHSAPRSPPSPCCCKKLGDLLILGLNTDTSVRQLKGPTRPVNNQEKRAMNLSKLDEVDFIILFAEETPEKLIHTIKPDILLKGGDYKVEEIVGYDFLQSYGGQVITIPTLEGYSTTSLIEKNKKS